MLCRSGWLLGLWLLLGVPLAGQDVPARLQEWLATLTLLALAVLIAAVPRGLLGLPDMHVAGNHSSAWNLHWFADQRADVLPTSGVPSVSLWVYKIAMWAWALWAANAPIGWLCWGFDARTHGGYWHKREPKPVAVPPPVPAVPIAESPSHG